ncbi:MAG: hypothetical protein WBW73_13930 [Rhodoplanes sp.]
MPIGLSDEQLAHLRGVTKEVPHRMREDFVRCVFDRLEGDGQFDVITMAQLSLAVSHAVRWIGLRG